MLLDEPTNDVDPLRRRLLWRQIRALAEGGSSVLLVTHNVLEAEQAVHRLAVVDRGKVLARGTPSELKAGQRHELRLSLSVPPGAAPPAPPPFAREQVLLGRRFDLLVPEAEAPAAIDWSRSAMAAGEDRGVCARRHDPRGRLRPADRPRRRDRLPGWLAALHQGLPFVHAASVVRASLTPLPVEHLGRSFLILGVWAAVSWTVTIWVVNRRG